MCANRIGTAAAAGASPVPMMRFNVQRTVGPNTRPITTNLTDTYNARVSVRDIEGKVTTYASVIDMLTNDPTYVPAQ